ncbi:hypothetical protein P7C70_g1110, partial [Phenoliferia sp. Uapishka_3]
MSFLPEDGREYYRGTREGRMVDEEVFGSRLGVQGKAFLEALRFVDENVRGPVGENELEACTFFFKVDAALLNATITIYLCMAHVFYEKLQKVLKKGRGDELNEEYGESLIAGLRDVFMKVADRMGEASRLARNLRAGNEEKVSIFILSGVYFGEGDRDVTSSAFSLDS